MNILTADIGSTYTKLTAINTTEQKIIATSAAFTTIEDDVMNGFMSALRKLEETTGKFNYDELLCCSSAAGGLKMVALGLVPELTSKAAKLAAASAGAKVVSSYAFEISKAEKKEIYDINPDLVLLCGGIDGGNKEVIISNAQTLSEIDRPFTIIVAGNKSASFEIEEIFTNSGKSFVITENVMPEFNELNIEPARKEIKRLFISRIIDAKGLSGIQNLCKEDIIPTPLAVLNACELLSLGTAKEKGLGELMAVDIGGATTDVYSIAKGHPTISNVIQKGLPEPVSKRTVEGDIGMRYTLQSLTNELDIELVAEELNANKDEVSKWITRCINNPESLALPNSTEQKIEEIVARGAVRIAAKRHVGRYRTAYTPLGQVYTLTGKDLSEISTVIGIGGIIVNSKRPELILDGIKPDANGFEFAMPKKPKYMIDRKYIFSSMGLLCNSYPDLALTLMKQDINTINI